MNVSVVGNNHWTHILRSGVAPAFFFLALQAMMMCRLPDDMRHIQATMGWVPMVPCAHHGAVPVSAAGPRVAGHPCRHRVHHHRPRGGLPDHGRPRSTHRDAVRRRPRRRRREPAPVHRRGHGPRRAVSVAVRAVPVARDRDGGGRPGCGGRGVPAPGAARVDEPRRGVHQGVQSCATWEHPDGRLLPVSGCSAVWRRHRRRNTAGS
jgi:hypothetical protein